MALKFSILLLLSTGKMVQINNIFHFFSLYKVFSHIPSATNQADDYLSLLIYGADRGIEVEKG